MLKKLIRQNAATFISMLLLVLLPVVVSSGLGLLLYVYNEWLLHLNLGQMLLYFGVVSLTMAFVLTPTTFCGLSERVLPGLDRLSGCGGFVWAGGHTGIYRGSAN